MKCDIKDLRESKHWSLSQLALFAGLNKGRVSEIERGIRRPTRSEKEALEHVLDAEVHQWVEVPPRN